MASSLNLTRQNRNRSIAANLASSQMDTVRSMDFDDLNGVTQQAQPTAPRRRASTACPTPSRSTRGGSTRARGCDPRPCQAPPSTANPLAYIAVVSSVRWNDMRGVPPVTEHGGHAAGRHLRSDRRTHRRDGPDARRRAGLRRRRSSRHRSTTGVSDSATSERRVRVLCVRADRDLLGHPVGGREGRRAGQRGAAADRDREGRLDEHRPVPVRLRVSWLVLTLQGNGGFSVPNAVPISLGNTHLLPLGVKPIQRLREPADDHRPVPVRRRLPDLGRRLFRRRSAGREPVGQRLLPGRDPLRRHRHDPRTEQHRQRAAARSPGHGQEERG